MQDNRVSKSEFKAKALEYFRRVESSGDRMVITDHGTPALEVRPYRGSDRDPLTILRGSVLRYDDPLTPVDVEWEVAQ